MERRSELVEAMKRRRTDVECEQESKWKGANARVIETELLIVSLGS